MNILGISSNYHDSAACVIRDGRIVAAAQEERFTRIKHDPAFPAQAIDYCLEAADLTPDDLDWVAYYEKPLAKFDRILSTQLAYAPRGFNVVRRALPMWLKDKLRLRATVRSHLQRRTPARLAFPSHHESHAASAFYPSPFSSAAILTVDGVGEWATASIGVGDGASIRLLHEQRFPHSLGLLYSAFTAYCGFRVNNGEYKLMGLAPYGEPRFVDTILHEVVQVQDDGAIALNMAHFAFGYSDRSTTASFHALFGGPPRAPDAPITQRHKDVARSIQHVTEEIVIRMAKHALAVTGETRLVMAGGVALNCVANGRILREAGVEDLWIQPAAGDAGGALGAALFTWHQLLSQPRTPSQPDAQSGSLLGAAFDPVAIDQALAAHGLTATPIAEHTLADEVAQRLADGAIVGHFSGRMEFGPRALGARSILADPRPANMQDRINGDIKFRESFRPFAPAILAEHVTDHFDGVTNSPYMLQVGQVADHHPAGARLPAITHVDGSARIQTVDDRSPDLRAILTAFHQRTGVPVLVNTSFNVRGEPIVHTPADAIRCFTETNLNVLVLGDRVIDRDAQPALGVVSGPVATPQPRWSIPASLDWHPTARKLRHFGWIAAAVFGGLALLAWQQRAMFSHLPDGATIGTAATLALLGTLAGLLSAVRPTLNRPLWRTLSALTWPIGQLVSTVLIGLVFFGLFVPIGLWYRWTGRDRIRQPLDAARSEWHPVAPSPTSSYLKQY